MATLNQLHRFIQKIAIDHDGPLTNGEPCWLWQGARNNPPWDYGTLTADGKRWLAHRWFFFETGESIPLGYELDHLCRRPSCVNPAHLEPVTHRENVIRGAAADIQRLRLLSQTHCKHGHELTADNTYRAPKQGHRSCRTCRNTASRRAYQPKPPQTHCKNGHPLSGVNLFVNSEKRRVCRTCKRENDRANQQRYRDKKKAA